MPDDRAEEILDPRKYGLRRNKHRRIGPGKPSKLKGDAGNRKRAEAGLVPEVVTARTEIEKRTVRVLDQVANGPHH